MAPIAALTIHFIRKVKIEDKKRDDVMNIFPSAKKEGAFEIRYRSPEALASGDVWITQMFATAQDLEEYVLSHLELQNYDEEPFEYIQFTWPSGPAVLLKHDRVLICLAVLMRILRTHLKSWPVRLEDKKPSESSKKDEHPTYPVHEFYDDDSSFRRY
jgi:hypothetical protein